MMIYVIGAVAAVLLLILLVGGLARRIDLTSCCSIADPRHDARMRAAFSDARVPDDRAATTPTDE